MWSCLFCVTYVPFLCACHQRGSKAVAWLGLAANNFPEPPARLRLQLSFLVLQQFYTIHLENHKQHLLNMSAEPTKTVDGGKTHRSRRRQGHKQPHLTGCTRCFLLHPTPPSHNWFSRFSTIFCFEKWLTFCFFFPMTHHPPHRRRDLRLLRRYQSIDVSDHQHLLLQQRNLFER